MTDTECLRQIRVHFEARYPRALDTVNDAALLAIIARCDTYEEARDTIETLMRGNF